MGVGIVVGSVCGCVVCCIEIGRWKFGLVTFWAGVALSSMRFLPTVAMVAPIIDDVIDYFCFDSLCRWG